MKNNCPICQRVVPDGLWEKHHLVPKSKEGKDTINLCKCCGDMVHKVISLNDLRDKYNTIELLLSHPEIKKWAKWANKKPNDFSICMKTKKGR